MKTGVLALAAILLFGCNDAEQKVNGRGSRRGLTYVQDKSTGLCFAAYNLGYSYGSITHVPCTDKVMELVNNRGPQ